MAFNNAGFVGFTRDLAHESVESFDKVTAVNLRGIWTCMKHELRQMRTQGSGAIVNCSRLGGFRAGRSDLVSRHEPRSDRPDQKRRDGLCAARHSDQCRVRA